MRRINLLPPDERRRKGALPGGAILGALLVAGAAFVMVAVGVYLFYLARLNNEEERIAGLDRQITQQNQRIAELEPFRDLQARLDAKKPVADGIYRSRFSWDLFLQGLSFVIPPTTALNSLTAQASPINIQAPPEQPLSPPGAVTFTGVALPDYANVADFVVQMNNLRYLSNTTLNSAELDRETFARPAIDFEVASELITEVGANGTEVPIDEGSLDEASAAPRAAPREPTIGGAAGGEQAGVPGDGS